MYHYAPEQTAKSVSVFPVMDDIVCCVASLEEVHKSFCPLFNFYLITEGQNHLKQNLLY
jgi:hypothetical protein